MQQQTTVQHAQKTPGAVVAVQTLLLMHQRIWDNCCSTTWGGVVSDIT
jgi:hypothetical protein